MNTFPEGQCLSPENIGIAGLKKSADFEKLYEADRFLWPDALIKTYTLHGDV